MTAIEVLRVANTDTPMFMRFVSSLTRIEDAPEVVAERLKRQLDPFVDRRNVMAVAAQYKPSESDLAWWMLWEMSVGTEIMCYLLALYPEAFEKKPS